MHFNREHRPPSLLKILFVINPCERFKRMGTHKKVTSSINPALLLHLELKVKLALYCFALKFIARNFYED